ncbi:alpha/beta fold hydrolase [Falsiroseomonas sp. HW251]|uniref:alpha/beta fold hydrolase n=1 Tax=Falsiroseomonas sp. HW251 TaxID=3390998 RepID=UPI003D321458
MTGMIHTRDGVALFHRDWGSGPPVVFLAGWSMPSDSWSRPMLALADRGLRCIAYDRRAHGRSADSGRGYDFDTLADDLASVMDALDLRGATLVGHSMAFGEIIRYLTRHGMDRIARIALVAPTTPCLRRGADNPDGLDPAVFEAVRDALRNDLPAWVDANLPPFVMPDTSPGTRDWLRAMPLGASLQALVALNRAIEMADFRAEMRGLRLPALVIHGDSDASAPLPLCGAASAALIPGARLEVYDGAPHGLFVTHAGRLSADLLAFAREGL